MDWTGNTVYELDYLNALEHNTDNNNSRGHVEQKYVSNSETQYLYSDIGLNMSESLDLTRSKVKGK